MQQQQRLLSIDVLRGMTIFFMIVVNTPGSWQYVYAPLRHATWDGWTPTDLVFPFFVFIVGLSMAYSFQKYQTERSALIKKILTRTALIFLVGLLLNWYPFFNKSLSELRIFGVLQRIALAYGFGALMCAFLSIRYLYLALGIILVGYWGLLLSVGGPEPLSLENNLVRLIDLKLLGENHVYHGYGIPFDPEGILSTLPTVGTVILGFLTGKMMQLQPDNQSKIRNMVISGGVMIVLAYAWQSLGFPINKPIWSSSYVLLTAGLAMLLLALLLWLIDVKGWKKWTYIFRVFGLNPLASYAFSGLIIKTFALIQIGDQRIYGWLYAHFFQPVFGNYLGSFIQALAYTMLIWLFAWELYKRNKVIKL
jgi:predicted acyltransferase